MSGRRVTRRDLGWMLRAFFRGWGRIGGGWTRMGPRR